MRQSFRQVRFLFLILVVLVGAVATAPPIRAQRATKARWIHFARGESSAVIGGKLYPDKVHMFRFRGSKGQKLVVKLTSPANERDPGDAVVFGVQSKQFLPERSSYVLSGMDRNGVTEWEGQLPVTGVYEIVVFNPPISNAVKRKSTYTLKVSIE
jgi:hypothetical protein